MGGVSAVFKAFAEQSLRPWLDNLRWRDKVAAGFTHSQAMSGDKLHTLQYFTILAAQHGMLWVPLDLYPGWCSSTGAITDRNRLGAWLGVISQSNHDAAIEAAPNAGDLQTARHLGRRVAAVTRHVLVGRHVEADRMAQHARPCASTKRLDRVRTDDAMFLRLRSAFGSRVLLVSLALGMTVGTGVESALNASAFAASAAAFRALYAARRRVERGCAAREAINTARRRTPQPSQTGGPKRFGGTRVHVDSTRMQGAHHAYYGERRGHARNFQCDRAPGSPTGARPLPCRRRVSLAAIAPVRGIGRASVPPGATRGAHCNRPRLSAAWILASWR
jgi:hypothetical protein